MDIPFFTFWNHDCSLSNCTVQWFVWRSRNRSWLDVTVLIQTDLLISGCDVRVSDFWKDPFRWTQLQGAIATRVKCTWPHTCTHTQYTIKHVHKPTQRKNYIVLAWHMKFNELLFNRFYRCVFCSSFGEIQTDSCWFTVRVQSNTINGFTCELCNSCNFHLNLFLFILFLVILVLQLISVTL